MKKVLGSLVLVGILATGSMAQYYKPKGIESDPDWVQGTCYSNIKFLDESIECTKEKIEWYAKQGRMDGVYNETNSLGDYYRLKGDYKNAIKYALQAAEGFRKLGIKVGEADSYYLLGDIYKNKGNKDKAIEYYTKASEFYKAAGNKGGEAESYEHIGFIYEDKRNKDKAIEYHTKAYEIYKSIGCNLYLQDILDRIKELKKKKH